MRWVWLGEGWWRAESRVSVVGEFRVGWWQANAGLVGNAGAFAFTLAVCEEIALTALLEGRLSSVSAQGGGRPSLAHYRRPVTLPSASRSIPSALGFLGRPGRVLISPARA